MGDMSARKLGVVVRARRKELGRTLADISGASGLSVPFLSQIENGRANASLRSLQVLADALDTTAMALLGAADDASRVDVVRAGDNTIADTTDGTARLLVRGARQLHALEFTGATGHGDREFRHENDELLYVVSGSVRVRTGDTEHTLDARDTLYCAGGTPHSWHALSPDTRLLVIAVRDDPR